MENPFQNFSKKDWALWISSMAIVTAVNLFQADCDWLMLVTTWIGATALIFAAKGNVWAQILIILFSILYGIISWRVSYWGEMITYLGMTMPMAIWATISWARNPTSSGKTVAIQKLTAKKIVLVLCCTLIVTILFYFVLRFFQTPNLIVSTISIATSFLAAFLTVLRSSFYALAYAANDAVLLVLWSLLSMKDPSYIPVVANFGIFLLNDLYGFIRWRQRERADLS